MFHRDSWAKCFKIDDDFENRIFKFGEVVESSEEYLVEIIQENSDFLQVFKYDLCDIGKLLDEKKWVLI